MQRFRVCSFGPSRNDGNSSKYAGIRTCPIPTIPPFAPSFRSMPPPTSRSRICPMACSRRQRACAARRRRDRRLRARSLGARTGLPAGRRPAWCVRAPSLNHFMALGPKVWSRTRARISELLRHDHPELRDNATCASARWCRWPMPNCICLLRSPATPISIRRRSTPPMSASCSAARTMRCSRTGCICRSAITDVRRPWWSPAPRCAGRAAS